MNTMATYLYLIIVLLTIHSTTGVVPVRQEDTGSARRRTFGQVSAAIGEEMSAATLEMLKNLKDEKISLIVEQSWEESRLYEESAVKIARDYSHSVESVAYLKSSILYSVEKDAESVMEMVREAASKSKLTLLIMSMRLAKECLVAGFDLKLHAGNHAFVVYEPNVLNMLSNQLRPFKWATVSYTSESDESFEEFLTRSRKLCWMLERIFVVMASLPDRLMEALTERVPKLYRKDKKVLVENLDMLQGAVKIEFTERGSYGAFVDEYGGVEYPLGVYRYGMGKGRRAGARCATLLSSLLMGTASKEESSSYPSMHKIASFSLHQKNSQEWDISFTRRSDRKSFRSLKLKSAASQRCTDESCKAESRELKFPFVEFIFVMCVGLILFVAFFTMYRQYRRGEAKQSTDSCSDDKCLLPSEVRIPDTTEHKHLTHV